MSQEQIPQLGGYGEITLDAAFSELAREVEASAAALSSPGRSQSSAEAVEAFRLHWLGRKQGRLKSVSEAWLKAAPPDAKRQIGQRFNRLKELIEQRLEAAAVESSISRVPKSGDSLDITLPGSRRALGS